MGFDNPRSQLDIRGDFAFNNAFIDRIYGRLAPIYDLVFGEFLQPGRKAAMARMGLGPGNSVLEVGVGTGINLPLYPPESRVTGIDLSSAMLEKARERTSEERLSHVRLYEMDAAHLAFPDDSFDVVYAPYAISAMPDPARVAREMRRVCRPNGTILFLNHFRSANPLLASAERAIAPIMIRVGFKSDLDLSYLLQAAQLDVRSIEKVNMPPLWSLVTCVKD